MAAFFYSSPRALHLWTTLGILPNANSLMMGDVLQYGTGDNFDDLEHTCIVTSVDKAKPLNSVVHQHGLGPSRDFNYLNRGYSTKWWTAWRIR
jgi:hypothetical protein